MKPVKRALGKLVSLMDLPADVVADLPRVTMTGNTELLIENHRGISRYTQDQICVGYKGGIIIISGRRLAIKYIEKDTMQILGIISDIQFGQ